MRASTMVATACSPAAPGRCRSTYHRHRFYDSGWQVLETRDTTTENDGPESLQPKYQYVWSARYIDAPVLRDKNTDQDGLCDDGRIYYLGDANFNVTTLTDTAGDAIERYLYAPYGKPTIYTGDWTSTRSSSNYSNTILYTGREWDPETGLYHNRNRYYHAELGRFINRDPIEYGADDENVYRYVFGNPVGALDPSGSYSKKLSDVYLFWDNKTQKCMLAFQYTWFPSWYNYCGFGCWTVPKEKIAVKPFPFVFKESECNRCTLSKLTSEKEEAYIYLQQTGALQHCLTIGHNNASVSLQEYIGGLTCGVGMSFLKCLGTAGKGRGVRQVVGGADDAKDLFDALRGANAASEVKPGVWVAKGKCGGNVTFRASSKSGPPTVDVHGIEEGVRKIKFVSAE